MGSGLCHPLNDGSCVDLDDVTLVDTNSTDQANWAILGNAAMQVAPPGTWWPILKQIQVVPPGGKIYNQRNNLSYGFINCLGPMHCNVPLAMLLAEFHHLSKSFVLKGGCWKMSNKGDITLLPIVFSTSQTYDLNRSEAL